MGNYNAGWQPTRDRHQDGFTYIGLLILIAILGVISAGSLSTGAIAQRRAHEEELLYIGSQFQAAFKSYYESTPIGQRPYPSTLNDLVKDPRFPTIRRHLRKIYIDPLTGQANWGTAAAPGGGIAGIYSRSEEKPIKIAGFPAEFALFEGKEKFSDRIFGYTPIAPRGLMPKK